MDPAGRRRLGQEELTRADAVCALGGPDHLIQLPGKAINTGYGVKINEGQGAYHFLELAEAAGFEIISRKDEAGWFYLELKKGS